MDVGQAKPAGIVEMAAPEPIAGDIDGARKQLAHHVRVGIADGIGQADAVGAGIEQRLHQPQYFIGVDMALQRAAECRADAAFDQRPGAAGIARGADARHVGNDFVGRLAQVGQAVRMAGRQRHEHQVRAAGQRILRAAQVRHQHRDEQTRQRARERDQLRGIGQLRQQVRRHERADFQLTQAGRVRAANPRFLAGRGQDGADALQAVAQTDFADHGLAGEGVGHGSRGRGEASLGGGDGRTLWVSVAKLKR
ncbi:hypothetical protein D3C72_897670 [compost metagenome]